MATARGLVEERLRRRMMKIIGSARQMVEGRDDEAKTKEGEWTMVRAM